MKIKQSIMLVSAMLSLASCSQVVYQVYEVQSPDMVLENNSMVFENEDCKISYNLWGIDGSLTFIFENTSEKDIFIDMSQSFFIKNGAAYDYYKNRSYDTNIFESVELGISASNTYISPAGYWPNRYSIPLFKTEKASVSTKKGFSMGVRVEEPKIVCIPANAYKVLGVYKIYPSIVGTSNRKMYNPKTETTLAVYNRSNSPLRFINRISYSIEDDKGGLYHVDNNFWLSSVKNYSKKAATEIKGEKRYFKIGGPNQFYKPFKATLQEVLERH